MTESVASGHIKFSFDVLNHIDSIINIHAWGVLHWTHFKQFSTLHFQPHKWVYVVMAAEDHLFVSVWLHEKIHAHWTLEAAGRWMSFIGDPEDSSECVSVSLIKSNTRLLAHVVRLMKLSEKEIFPWFIPAMKLRVMGWGSATRSYSLSNPHLQQRDRRTGLGFAQIYDCQLRLV